MQNRKGYEIFRVSLVVFLLLFLFLKYTMQLFPAVSATTLLARTHHSATDLGLLGGAFFYTYLAFQIPAGVLVDHFPLMKSVLVSLFFCFLGVLVFLISSSFEAMFMGRMLMGLGAAFATVCYMKAAAMYFSDRWFLRLSGFFGTACMGGAGTTLLLFGAIDEFYGFSFMMKSIALFSAIMFVLSILFFLADKKHSQKPNNIKQKANINLKQIVNDSLKIVTKRNNILLFLYNGLSFAPVAIFGGLWGVNYFVNMHHFSVGQAHLATSLLFYGFAFGGPLLAFICRDIHDQKRYMMLGILVSACLFAMLVFLPNATFSVMSINVLMFAIGFFNSPFLFSYSLVKKLNSAVVLATVIAIVNMGDPFFGGIGEPVMGYIFDHFGNGLHSNAAYHAAFSLLIVYWLCSCVSAFFIRLKPNAEDVSQTMHDLIDESEYASNIG